MLYQPINNRHIIDDALNALATALSPFVADKTGAAAPTDLSALLREMLGRWDDAFHANLGRVDAKIQAMTVRRFPLRSTASNDEKRLPSDDLPQRSRRNVGAGIGAPSVKSLDVNRP